ncbi:MAG: hypothetical protein QOC87_114 [Actinomycetota bacterium]|nr:hypothetical protein [Actinomycetota bacterium]
MTTFKKIAGKTFSSLRIRNYRLYFFGQIISMSGTWMQIVGQGWLVLKLTGSGIDLGLVTALQFVPVLVGGAWGGIVADRVNKHRLVTWTQVAAGILAIALGALTVTGVVTLWMVYLLAFLLGCVTVFDVPARQSFVMEIVGPDDVANAVGLNTTVFTSARIVGPAIAAVIIALFGIGPCFFINGISYIAVIAGLLMMDPSELRQVDPIPRGKGQIREGLRYVWSRPELRSTLLVMAVVGTLAFNFRILLPLMVRDVFSGGAGLYGVLSSVMGVGTLIGALISAGRSKPTRRLLVGTTLAFGILMILAGIAPSLALEVAVLIPLGAVSIAFIATANSTLQLNSSDSMRGRVMALYSIVFLGSTPIGGPLVGWIAQSSSVGLAFVIPGIATAASGVAAMWALRRSTLAAGETDVPERLPEDPAPGEPRLAERALHSARKTFNTLSGTSRRAARSTMRSPRPRKDTARRR